jgi:O-acetyl-ADP-ribose deacetylase (regulator of RNase III)
LENYRVDPSQGTHFFQNLTSFGVGYFTIHKKAGSLMKEACIHLNKTKGGCQTGCAEVTVAGDLPAKFVIHAVAPRWLNGEKNEPQLLCNTYSNFCC